MLPNRYCFQFTIYRHKCRKIHCNISTVVYNESDIQNIAQSKHNYIWAAEFMCVIGDMFRPTTSHSQAHNNSKQDKEFSCKLAMRRAPAIIVEVEKQ